MTDNVSSILIGLVVLVWILSRQLQARAISRERVSVVVLVAGVLGVVQVAQYADKVTVPVAAWGLLLLSLAAGVVMGVIRGATVRVWRDSSGVLTRQGTPLTLALWIVSIALHLGIDLLLKGSASHADQLGSVSILVYLALTLASQRVVIVRRGRELAHGAEARRGVSA